MKKSPILNYVDQLKNWILEFFRVKLSTILIKFLSLEHYLTPFQLGRDNFYRRNNWNRVNKGLHGQVVIANLGGSNVNTDYCTVCQCLEEGGGGSDGTTSPST